MHLTENRRIYAIGDVHGCRDALDALLRQIDADLAVRPHDRPLLVLLGDYTDRGPDSRGVLDRLIARMRGPVQTVCLLGNHDHSFLRFIQEPQTMMTPKYHWLDTALGGQATLASYGVTDLTDRDAAYAAFTESVPAEHLTFLQDLTPMLRLGGYVFVHAGLRPGVALDKQDIDDLIWIREPFLSYPHDHPGIVVHGHTAVPEVEHHGNRIAVDTGAVFGGRLSCLVLEGGGVWTLQDGTLHPCPPGTGLAP
ncbi:MAG: metallophosphoesterase family protein [Pseudomonadota bacterium]